MKQIYSFLPTQMNTVSQWKDKIFNVTDAGFKELALEIFFFQYRHNVVYKSYVDGLRIDPGAINDLTKIPFLPIRLFRTHEVKTGSFSAEQVFISSGTTGTGNSRHFVKDISF